MSMAVQLAKRDLKKQKEAEKTKSMQQTPVTKKEPKRLAKGKAQIVHSREYQEKLQKRAERQKRNDQVSYYTYFSVNMVKE